MYFPIPLKDPIESKKKKEEQQYQNKIQLMSDCAIGLAFFTYDDRVTAVTEKTMEKKKRFQRGCIDVLQDLYHRESIKGKGGGGGGIGIGGNQDPDEENVRYSHVAIIIKHPVRKCVHIYHYNRNGPICEEEKDFMKSYGWEQFRVVWTTQPNFDEMVTYLDTEYYKRMQDGYRSQFDAFFFSNPITTLFGVNIPNPIITVFGVEYVTIAPLRFIPYVGPWIPYRETSFICSDFICRALKVANVPEVKHLDHKAVTAHTLYLLFKDHDPPMVASHIFSTLMVSGKSDHGKHV